MAVMQVEGGIGSATGGEGATMRVSVPISETVMSNPATYLDLSRARSAAQTPGWVTVVLAEVARVAYGTYAVVAILQTPGKQWLSVAAAVERA